MKKILLLSSIAIIAATRPSFSQKSYWASAGEMIFSYGKVSVDDKSVDVHPVVRWSPFFNLQAQFHHNFNQSVGIYTGLGVRNVGLISRLNFVDTSGGDLTSKEARVKERSYSLGVPLALKFGNLEDGVHVSVGAEAELMFAYKRKIFVDDSKTKSSAWFSDNVNLFNPSAFVEVNFKSGPYIRFKYYILDFLNYQGITISETRIDNYGPKSPLFYISIGSANIVSEIEKSANNKPKEGSAFFRTKKKDQKNIATVSAFQ